ncbi:winged helix-turn-helix transcriptional regulator [Bordetella hinzii]|uniref:Transcriptional regulator n=2 Tax=Bordetella hinzii TaxID=103855 RepID=A0AAN1VHT3_9BORD|nr:putative HTH-type transcriptional regulator YybR [Bordetella hinzii]KCB31547.1 transcriptional regulator, HxlR family [Bordetella hinzii L60]KCB32713.1 transcriptional regulator, HxlR family [Bordetella hinzii CA90 BAL1384]KCB40588.1 transcriptional regulator, HxlR family [Bordetella hinzii 5132]AKQ59885.1 putative HTH-type transcriptional regulator YybR [Bordetella hinzii]
MGQDMASDYTPCPVARGAGLLGDRWALLILRDAFDGERRFNGFQKNLGIARNMLADRLRKLVQAGILETVPAGPHHEYQLTDKGRDLFPLIVSLRQWGERHLYAPGEAHSVLVDKQHGKPLADMQPRCQAGEVLRPEDTEVCKLPALKPAGRSRA